MGLGDLLGGGALFGGPQLLGLLGGATGLGGSFLGANQARHTADEFRSEGDPYRSLLRQYTADPNSYFKGPIGQELARQADQRYSANFGNPAGSGTAQALSLQAMLQGYGQERDRLARMGGLDYWNKAYPQARAGQNDAYLGIVGQLQKLLGMGAGFMGGGGGGGGIDPGMLPG